MANTTQGQIQNLLQLYQNNSGNALTDRQQLQSQLAGGQDALTKSLQAAFSAAMPTYFKNLQSLRESNVARGAGTGGLGTTTEGDLTSAFQRNLANAAGSQAMNLYNTQTSALGSLLNSDNQQNSEYASMLGGERDYETEQANARKQRKGGLFGGIGSLLGGVASFLIPGGQSGALAGLGSSIGGALGGGIGGLFG